MAASPAAAAAGADTVTAATPPAVLEALVGNHRRFLAFVEKRVGSRDVAEDIVQEAFARGLERAGQVRDEESAVAWFYRVLRNAMADHWRRRGAEARMHERVAAESDEVEPPVDEELLRTACDCVLDLLPTLKPEYAEALRRVDLDGQPVKDFADAAGITPGNASVRLFRARESLRKQVTRSCGTCAKHGCEDCSCGR